MFVLFSSSLAPTFFNYLSYTNISFFLLSVSRSSLILLHLEYTYLPVSLYLNIARLGERRYIRIVV